MSSSNGANPFDGINLRQDGLTRYAIRIRMLPKHITPTELKTMLVFTEDYTHIDLLGKGAGDGGFQTAIVQFRTLKAAEEAKALLDGKRNGTGDANLQIEIIQRSPGGSLPQIGRQADASNFNRQPPRFNGTYSNLERTSPPRTSPFTNGDQSRAETFGGMFPQPPHGQPLERQRVSGRSVIEENGVDDETGRLLKDPVAYAQSDMAAASMQTQSRRATLPQIPTAGLNSLTIDPGVTSPPLTGLSSPRGPPVTSPTAFSPPGLNGLGQSNGYPVSPQQYPRAQMPPVNPADQNPPCNTLYVGNLPIDTSEDELKHLFSKQRGYKRLCFRTKANGPMCFVEFETITHATKALQLLYGVPLSNSIKGGIRLSFSKNPLGVRGHGGGYSAALNPLGNISSTNGYNGMQPFNAANGPPPGLSAPPGLISPIGQMHSGYFNGGAVGSLSPTPMSPNGASPMSLRSPTAASGNSPWGETNGDYADYLRSR